MRSELLVGADGAWSKVRPLLSHAKPEYVGASFIETYLYDADERHAAAAEAVGCGALFALAQGKGIFVHREAGSVLHAYVALRRPAEWFAGIDFADAAPATARVATEFDGWSPALAAVITDSDTPAVLRTLNALPIDHRWDRVAGVTLLDGAELGKALAAHPDDSEAALKAYEAAMFPRSELSAADAHQILELCLGDRAPFGLIEFFNAAQDGPREGAAHA